MSIENGYLVIRLIRKMDRYHSAKYEAIVFNYPKVSLIVFSEVIVILIHIIRV